MAEAEQNAPLERRFNEARALNYEAEVGLNQQKAHMQRVQFANNIAKQAFAYADKTGLKQGTPEYDQAVRQAAEPFRGAMSQAFGHADTGEPIDVNALRSLASMDAGGAEYHPPVTHAGGIAEWTPQGWRNVEVNGQQLKPGQYDVATQYGVGKAKAIANLVQQGHITPQQAESLLNDGQALGRQVPIVQMDKDEEQALIQAANQGDPAAIKRIESLAQQQEPLAIIPSAAQRQQTEAKIKTEAGINEAVGKEKAKAQFEAERDLPAVINKAENALKLISELQTHPGKAGMVGMPNLSGALGGVRGTKEASFNTRLAQIKGQTFLQAFDSLKGAGQITEIEGEKATSAIARLDTAQEEKEFDSALKDLSEVVMTGLANAKKRAGVSSQQSNKPDSKMQEWDALPSGAIFTTPEGRKVRKP